MHNVAGTIREVRVVSSKLLIRSEILKIYFETSCTAIFIVTFSYLFVSCYYPPRWNKKNTIYNCSISSTALNWRSKTVPISATLYHIAVLFTGTSATTQPVVSRDLRPYIFSLSSRFSFHCISCRNRCFLENLFVVKVDCQKFYNR